MKPNQAAPRIVSLLPSATELICALGLEPALVGISHECDYPPGINGLPRVTRTRIAHDASSRDIDIQVREELAGTQALYSLDLDTLRELAPDGINIFYDNVGGDVLQAAVENITKFGRIVLCGQIAAYNGSAPVPGPRNMMRLVYGSVTMQGFLLGDYEADIPAASQQLLAWMKEGVLHHREDIRSGFENLPETFGDLFVGRNDGTLLVVTDDAARGIPGR